MPSSADVNAFGGQVLALLDFLRSFFGHPLNWTYTVLVFLMVLNTSRRGFTDRVLRLATSLAALLAGIGLSKAVAGALYQNALVPALLSKVEETVESQGVTLLQALQQLDFLPGFLREDVFVRVQAISAQSTADIVGALQAVLLPVLEVAAFAVLYLLVRTVLWLLRRALRSIDMHAPARWLNGIFGLALGVAEALLAAWWMTLVLWLLVLFWGRDFPQGAQFIQNSSFYTFFSHFNPFAV